MVILLRHRPKTQEPVKRNCRSENSEIPLVMKSLFPCQIPFYKQYP